MSPKQLRSFLIAKAEQYESSAFIDSDPIAIPHRFSAREDIEIAAFLTATIAWGQRKSILQNARRLMQLMDQAPAQFIRQHQAGDREALRGFVHRTFQYADLEFFLRALQHLYRSGGGLQAAFSGAPEEGAMLRISRFREKFLALPHLPRSEKHLANPQTGSSAKRLNMFLRWMVRSSAAGVDFGLWQDWRPGQLSCPLDVHSGRVARALGLLERAANDARAVAELDQALRQLDPHDPVRFDFALFGLGVFESFGE